MAKQLAGKIALITGGGNGIGQRTALELAAHGAHVVSMDIDDDANERTRAAIRSEGGVCDLVHGDVAIAEDVERAFQTVGDIHILVNNAAYWTGDGYLHEVTEEDWDRVLAVSLKGVFLCCREALRRMMANGSGVIINISSINALTGIHLAAYTAAKGGLISLTRLLAQHYGPYGIRTVAICPGTILTPSSRKYYDDHPELEDGLRALYPASNFGTPEDIAKCVLFLASDDAKFINGSTVVVDGGASAVHKISPH